jgi:thiamine biosynthesis lipoprotein
MAADCEVVLAADKAEDAVALAALAEQEVFRIERKYSRYRSDSVTSRINAAAGVEWVDCDDETTALLDYAEVMFRQSEGAFDITSGVLRRVWDFALARVPTRGEIETVLPLIGWSRVERDGSRVRLPDTGMELDFGGFGKEYAADQAIAALRKRGVTSGYVNLAGDIAVLGPKPDGSAWLMGVQDPRRLEDLLASVPIRAGGLATSGDYERFFEVDGRRYCHVLDAATGTSVDHWRSVSVLAGSALVAGSCTSIAMLKRAAGLDFLDATGFDYIAVDARGELFQRGHA